jgi:hypothetical protein
MELGATKIHVFETNVTIRALAPKGRNNIGQRPGKS